MEKNFGERETEEFGDRRDRGFVRTYREPVPRLKLHIRMNIFSSFTSVFRRNWQNSRIPPSKKGVKRCLISLPFQS